MTQQVEVAEFYSSKGVKPDQVLKGKWEREREHIHDIDKPNEVRVWKNKEVKDGEYND